jgi:hypothetical protein
VNHHPLNHYSNNFISLKGGDKMNTKKTFFGILIIALIALAISPAIASTQAAPTKTNLKLAVAEWTINTNVGPVTI